MDKGLSHVARAQNVFRVSNSQEQKTYLTAMRNEDKPANPHIKG